VADLWTHRKILLVFIQNYTDSSTYTQIELLKKEKDFILDSGTSILIVGHGNLYLTEFFYRRYTTFFDYFPSPDKGKMELYWDSLFRPHMLFNLKYGYSLKALWKRVRQNKLIEFYFKLVEPPFGDLLQGGGMFLIDNGNLLFKHVNETPLDFGDLEEVKRILKLYQIGTETLPAS